MRNVRVLLMMVSLLCFVSAVNAQTKVFVRAAQIPGDTLDVGGVGNLVAGVDFDNDGKLEIYAVNNDWLDVAGKDWVPRIHKYENDGTGWKEVWSTAVDIPRQNTWPALTWGDWDQDGKKEVIYGPVNNLNTTENPNPARILVFEAKGDGSDVMGVDDGSGKKFLPNAKWTIVTTNMFELRPFRWFLQDIDSDGKIELIGCDRRTQTGAYRFFVIRVSNIPDNGDGSETWELVANGASATWSGTLYDVAIIGTTIYLIHDNGRVTPVKYVAGTGYNILPPRLNQVPGGSWKSASVVDLDKDGKKEIVIGGWSSATFNKIYLVQESADTLKTTQIADFAKFAGGRIYGGAAGDIDNNGKLDFVFGTRDAKPNAAIHRLEYLGGDITDPNNYKVTVIDSLLSPTGGRWDVVEIANVDADPELEVLYTGLPEGTVGVPPIVILDLQPGLPVELSSFTVSVIKNNVELNWATATETNNYGFEVLRSADQKNFQRIGFVGGHGTTTSPHAYRFVDRELASGTYYYRLRQIDTDGSSTLSEILRAEVATVVREYALHPNYPNPFNPKTTILFDLKEDGLARLRVFNMLGQQVAELVNGHLKAGSHTAILDATHLASGTYIYVLEVNGFRAQRRLQLVK